MSDLGHTHRRWSYWLLFVPEEKLPQDGEDFKGWEEIKENLSLFNLLQIKQKAEQKGLLFKEIGF